jgi:hypothetical protein
VQGWAAKWTEERRDGTVRGRHIMIIARRFNAGRTAKLTQSRDGRLKSQSCLRHFHQCTRFPGAGSSRVSWRLSLRDERARPPSPERTPKPPVLPRLAAYSDSFPHPLVHPVIHRLIPELGILRLQHPMSFVGEMKHFRRHTHIRVNTSVFPSGVIARSSLYPPTRERLGYSTLLVDVGAVPIA